MAGRSISAANAAKNRGRWRKLRTQRQSLVSDSTAIRELSRIDPDLAKRDFTGFNERVGLPQHPDTLVRQPLTECQMHFYNNYVPPDKPAWILLNKARQCGWTETVLRILAYHGFHKYAGRKIGIVAGTNQKTTRQIFGRLRELFKPLPHLVLYDRPMELGLVNGTEYHAGAANVETFTGWTKFGAFFMDEAAKWDLIDDRPVLNAMLPIARSNGSDVFMISTPKGPRGFFYHIDMGEWGGDKFSRIKYDIYEAGGELYTLDQIEEMIAATDVDPDQEYMCKYTSGRESVWGPLTHDDFTDEYMERAY